MGIKESIKHGMKSLGRGIKAKSPTILVVAGTIGLVGAGVMAVIKTKDELQAVLDQHKKDVEALKDIKEGRVILEDCTTEEFVEKRYKRLLTAQYLTTVARLAKVYALPLLMAALSITAIMTGHGILNKWHLTAVAECYSVKETLDEYRKRVAGVVGPDKEKDIFFDRAKEIVTETITDENGEEKQVSREVTTSTCPRTSYTYIVSEETMCDCIDFRWTADVENRLHILLNNANEYFTRHDRACTLNDFMVHHWKDEYLMAHPEVFTDGWMKHNPLVDESLPDINPIEMEVHKISGPGEPLKYSVTFNAQGNIVNAVAAANAKKRAAKKLNKKVKARVI